MPQAPLEHKLSADVEKGKDTSVLGNGDEEVVEKDGQGWLLGWETNSQNWIKRPKFCILYAKKYTGLKKYTTASGGAGD